MRRMTTVLLVVLSMTTTAAAEEWRQYRDAVEAGWSGEALAEARAMARAGGSASVMVVEDGIVVAAWGAVDRPFPIYSMRKGLYNALVGMLVGEGRIELGATLEEMGIDDLEPLSEVERSATVEDLLTSRSGVYLASAYEPASMKRSRPPRGSSRPGEGWFYNNWDFNVVAHLVERAAERDLAALFEERVAAPLGMEDFSPAEAFSFLEPSRSRFPAVVFEMSARDLARFGQLYLQRGVWNGQPLLEPSWIAASWTPRTTFGAGSPFGGGNGFGYLWWIHPAAADGEGPFARTDVYLTRGSGGQVLAVLPERELVIVHQSVAETGTFEHVVRLIDAILRAQERPATVALDPAPLGEPPAAGERRTATPWSPEMIERLRGEYSLSPQVSFVVQHTRDGRVFALPRGAPLAEVELFVDAAGTLFSPVLDVVLQPVRDERGEVVALQGRIEGRQVRLERSASTGDEPTPVEPSGSL